jgi:hypothetical protein
MKYLIAFAVILGLLLMLQKGCKWEPGRFRKAIQENRKERWERRWGIEIEPTDNPDEVIINRREKRRERRRGRQ